MEFIRKNAIQLILLLATGSLLYFALLQPPPGKSSSAKGIKYGEMKKISHDSVREIQINYDMTDMKNQASAPIQPHRVGKEHIPNVVNMQPNSGAFDADEEHSKRPPTLDAKMESFLAEREKFEEMEKLKRQEYVELFKTQAKQMGYDVEINSEMEIVRVRKTGTGNN